MSHTRIHNNPVLVNFNVTAACCPATHRRGFTLVETMIAMALLGLILAGSFSLLVGSYATMRRTDETIYINRLLETAMEMTRNLSFPDIAGDPSGTPAGYASQSPVKFSTDSSLLKGENNMVLFNKGPVTKTDPNAEMKLQDGAGNIYFTKVNDDLYKVTAVVSWTPYRLKPTTRSVSTFVGRKGINKR